MKNKFILLLVFSLGFVSLVSQVLILREFLLVFNGNELSIGVVLLAWMFWSSIGSWGFGTLTKKSSNSALYLISCQLALVVLLPIEIFLIRIMKFLLHMPHSEIIKISTMLFSAFFLILPYSILLGFMFSLSSRIYAQKENEEPCGRGYSLIGRLSGITLPAKNDALIIGIVYLIESIGAIAGGIIYNFLLIDKLDSFSIAYLISCINLVMAFMLVLNRDIFISYSNLQKKIIFIITLFIGICFFYIAFLPLNKISLKLQFREYELIKSKNSIYGNISIVKHKKENEIIFFENGLYLFTIPSDILSAEETAHISLLPHSSPQNVLLIGGGFSGVLEEILKQPVKKVVYAEPDPLVIELANQYNLKNSETNPVKIINIDGRRYVKSTEEQFDVVIINPGDPITAQLNRFYTLEFFQEVKKIFKPGGMISLKVRSTENYISEEQAQYISSLRKTLSSVFPEINIIIGQSGNFILAGAGPEKIQVDVSLLMRRLRMRRINAKYVREYYLLKAYMSPKRINHLLKTIDKIKNIKINRDFSPTCYYYNLIYWNALANPDYHLIFKRIFSIKLIWIIIFIFLLFIIIYFISKNNFLRQQNSILAVVMANGFSEILFEIVIILVFQSLYGYVYHKIGIIITSFMAGLSIGTFFAIKALAKKNDPFLKLMQIEGLVIVYPLFLLIVFSILQKVLLPDFAINIIFPALTMIAGFLGGYQFPYAVQAFYHENREIGEIAGILYGIDLAGSCIGAIITNLFLFPVLGLYGTCIVSMFLSLCAFIFLYVSRK